MTVRDRFERLAQHTPIVDTHNDFPYLVREQLHYEVQNDHDFTFQTGLTSHTDLAKLVRGRVGVQFFSCFIECKLADPLSHDFNAPSTVVRDTLEQIDFVRRLADMYPNDLEFVTSSHEARQAFRSGRLALSLGVEGLHQVDTTLAAVRQYFNLGVRYITLTHNCDNPFATAASSVSAGGPDEGLTAYGRRCIEEMNRLGMMVDLAHVSVQTMHDVLDVAQAPVMFSHSLAHAVYAHPRNVPDDVLKKVRANNGVVCVNFFPAFLCDGPASIDDAVAHILHIANYIGWEHVGLGLDFDGIPEGPKGLEDVSKYPDLVQKVMAASDASDEQIRMLMGENVLRVWRDSELVAESLAKTPVVDDNWDGRTWKFFSYAKDFPEVYPGARGKKRNEYSDEQSLTQFGK